MTIHLHIRKSMLLLETVNAEAGKPLTQPLERAAAIVVMTNPFAGRYVEDLSALFEVGAMLGEMFTPQLVKQLGAPAIAYGKAAIVGVAGDPEHAAAILHPKLGKPMRAALGGGEAIIPSSSKVGAAGCSIDVPLGNKDNVWSFADFDTMTVSVNDAPRPDEIVVVIALSAGSRAHERVGRGRVL